MIKKFSLTLFGIVSLALSCSTLIPYVAVTFGLVDTTARSIVNFVLATSNVVSIISMVGIIFGVGGFSLAVVQTIKYLAKKSFVKAVAW